MQTTRRKRTRIPKKALKARSGKYKFSVKTHPVEGIVSFGLGIISLIILLVCCYLAWQSRGNIGVVTALIGVAAFLISIGGLALAIIAAKKKDIHIRFPMLGGVLNGILAIIYLVIYVMGTLL